MAKVTFKPGNSDGYSSLAGFASGDLTFHNATRAVFVDSVNGFQIVVTGSEFAYNGLELIGGTVTGIAEKTIAGAFTSTITSFHVKPSALPDSSNANWPYDSQQVILKGNDTLIGSSGVDLINGYDGNDRINGKGGADLIYGTKGRDVITGATGDDSFYFYLGDGRDTVTDFKHRGDADVIFIQGNYETRNTHDGLLVESELGQSVLLEGFKKADLDPGDIVAFG